MKMAVKVVGHRILIKPDSVEKEHKVAGTDLKIALALDQKQYRAAVDSGVVLQIGPTAFKWKESTEPWCQVGDKVQYHRYSGKFVVDPETEEELVVVNDEDIHLIIVKDKDE
jgi:co-chaperonin GroES (HSP10)